VQFVGDEFICMCILLDPFHGLHCTLMCCHNHTTTAAANFFKYAVMLLMTQLFAKGIVLVTEEIIRMCHLMEWYLQGKPEVLAEKHYTPWVVDEWVWSNGGMILTGKNWNTRRKTLYSVGGRWMNEYGAMAEWYWQGKSEVLGEKPDTVSLFLL